MTGDQRFLCSSEALYILHPHQARVVEGRQSVTGASVALCQGPRARGGRARLWDGSQRGRWADELGTGLPAHLGFSFLYLVKKGQKERNSYYKHDQGHLCTVWTVVTHILIVLLFSGLLRRFRAKGVRKGSQPVSTPGRSAL